MFFVYTEISRAFCQLIVPNFQLTGEESGVSEPRSSAELTSDIIFWG